MKALAMSLGGGGAKIERSLRGFFVKDIATSEQTDPKFADIIRNFLTYKFADTNRDELRLEREEDRIVLGDGSGSGDDPDVGREAFMQSRDRIKEIFSQFDTVFLIASLGKGTGMGGILPAVELARELKMLTIPVIAFPDFSTHEVRKSKSNLANKVMEGFNALPVRAIVIENAEAYKLGMTEKQAHRELNYAIGRGLRSLIYAFLERSQVDRNDLAKLFAGRGFIKISYTDLDGSIDAARKESDHERQTRFDEIAKSCFQNQYYRFEGEMGRTIISIQGPLQMPTIAAIRNATARIARVDEEAGKDYHPIYVTAQFIPKPHCVSAVICSANVGDVMPLQIDWKTDTEESFLPTRYVEGPEDEDFVPLKVRVPQSVSIREEAPTKPEEVVAVAAAVPPAVPAPAATPATLVLPLAPPTDNKAGKLHLTAPASRSAIAFKDYVARMTGKQEERDRYLREVSKKEGGTLEGLVNLTRDEVIDEMPRNLFRSLTRDKKVLSHSNLAWFLEFIRSSVEFNLETMIKVGESKNYRSYRLGGISWDKLKDAADDAAIPLDEVRIVKFLKLVGEVYGPREAENLCKDRKEGESRTPLAPLQDLQRAVGK